MRGIEKLFRKISEKDRKLLLSLVDELLGEGEMKNLKIKKLQGSDFYRVRKRKFRLIFHYESSREIVIDSIKIRNEGTYKNF